MTTLTPGGNANLPEGEVSISIDFSPIAGADIDVSAFQLSASGKVRGDGDMCFYGQPSVSAGALRLAEATPGRVVFQLRPSGIDAAIEKIALTATIHENRARFEACSRLTVKVAGSSGEPLDAPIATQGMAETALILGEFYRRNEQWKFRLVAQGFTGGLAPLAQHFGVEVEAPAAAPAPVAAPTPAPAAPPPPTSSINLSKITLDKTKSTISLEKKADFGEIKINLNWNRGSSGGMFGFGKKKSVDLDLGCLFELQDGYKGAIQALGERFGAFESEPFIELLGDDRTGAVSEGEWLRINGKFWKDIKRVCVFAYIYEGAPDWKATDGVVTLYAPGQPPIEVKLNEEGGALGMCAVALLENDGGAVKVSREVRFFEAHPQLDDAYRWGIRWKVGSK
ncbi:TerD family protein [Parachitinimonas caeni]|uniref:TerD family protein n=1 Tax=Parachitinimonas caeni TaxID=3031301 RepID=A0ABT7E3N3_9NEIS|nr:TerD family protein [Parachitinimonas caeni]MDK2126933.1 TerD family protein [Parachitinimonas caeni]